MKKLLMITVIATLFSCSNNDPIEEGSFLTNGTKIKTVKKITSTGIIATQTDYEYNAEGYVSKTTFVSANGNNTITNFEYDSNNILLSFTKVITDPFGEISEEVNTLEYLDDLIVQICKDITHEDDTYNNPEVDKIKFDYNTSQHVNLFTHYYDEESEFYSCDDISSISNTENLEYDSTGNMIRYEDSHYLWQPNYFTYVYDNKNHPYANIKPDSFRKIYGFSTLNNIISATEYNVETNEAIGNIIYAYTFNSDNFPTSLDKTYISTDDNSSSTTRYEYVYY